MKIISYIKSLRLIPYCFVFYYRKDIIDLLTYERDKWLQINNFNKKGIIGFIFLLNMFPEYRSLFIHRTGYKWLSFFASGQTNLYFHTPSKKIGKGLVLWHGYSTVINAQEIGTDCQIWHLVTLGKKNINKEENRPIIGNNVSICAGSIVIGNISIGSSSVIGAGSVVTHSCVENSVLMGVPAKNKKYEIVNNNNKL